MQRRNQLRGMALDLRRNDSKYIPAPGVDTLNVVALEALRWAGFFWDLSRQEISPDLHQKHVFTPEQVEEIAEAFETIGYNLGDGVAYD